MDDAATYTVPARGGVGEVRGARMKGYEEWNNSSSIGERNAGQHSSTGNGQAASATPVDLPGNPTAGVISP